MEVKEAAKQLGVHVNTIYSYINIGRIKANKVGKSWEIADSEVSRLKMEQEMTPRKVIQMHTYLIDTIEKEAKSKMDEVLWLLKLGGEDVEFQQAIDRLSSIEDGTKKWDMLVEFKKYLEQGRDRWHENVEKGFYKMDEIIDKNLQPSERAVEFRKSGDYGINED